MLRHEFIIWHFCRLEKLSEGYILSIKDVEIICSFYEEAIFGLLMRWIIKEEKPRLLMKSRIPLKESRNYLRDSLSLLYLI